MQNNEYFEKKRKIVLVNNLGYLQSPFFKDATIEIEVSDEEYEKISSFPGCKAWKLNDDNCTFSLVTTPNVEALRFARVFECFNLLNKGNLWYEMLEENKKEELKSWYKAWLDITETGIIPEKPSWL